MRDQSSTPSADVQLQFLQLVLYKLTEKLKKFQLPVIFFELAFWLFTQYKFIFNNI
jgi:hypothetical protein